MGVNRESSVASRVLSCDCGESNVSQHVMAVRGWRNIFTDGSFQAVVLWRGAYDTGGGACWLVRESKVAEWKGWGTDELGDWKDGRTGGARVVVGKSGDGGS